MPFRCGTALTKINHLNSNSPFQHQQQFSSIYPLHLQYYFSLERIVTPKRGEADEFAAQLNNSVCNCAQSPLSSKSWIVIRRPSAHPPNAFVIARKISDSVIIPTNWSPRITGRLPILLSINRWAASSNG